MDSADGVLQLNGRVNPITPPPVLCDVYESE